MYTLDDLRGYTPATVRSAFNQSAEITSEHGDLGNVNVTGILTRIIQAAGRLNERYASDALFGLDKIRFIAENGSVLDEADKPFDEILTFGIREDGIDHNAYIMSNLLETRHMPTGYVFAKQRYRKILAVRMRAWMDKDYRRARADFSLRDLTNAFHTLDPADLSDDGWSVRNMPFENRSNPEPTDPRNRTDHAEIDKLRAEPYAGFRSRKILDDILRAEGCEGGVRAIEIDGVRDPRVPEPKDPGQDAVCRVYRAGKGIYAVSWIQPGYAYYDKVLEGIGRAKAALEKACGDEA